MQTIERDKIQYMAHCCRSPVLHARGGGRTAAQKPSLGMYDATDQMTRPPLTARATSAEVVTSDLRISRTEVPASGVT